MFRFLILAFLGAASASPEVFGVGPCPEVSPVADFSFPAYGGTWYEIARYPNAGEEGARGKCTSAEYFVHGNKGTLRNTHVIEGLRSYIKGDLTLVGPAKIMLTYTFGGLSKNSFLTVLKTDYTNYAIGYSCKHFPHTNTHQVFSWIKSRSRTLEGDAKIAVNNYISESPFLDASLYVLNDQSEHACNAGLTREIQEFLSYY